MHIQPSPAALAAIDRLEAHGFEAYVVGGCVRDALLGRVPNDWDLTTNALPEETVSCFADRRVIETGIKHGTVTVLWEGESLEITTYRRDGVYADNRHPENVSFSKTVADDLSRRDFTVNAMAYHPKRGLVDLFDGQADIKARRLRCVGDPRTRFCEDGLRILRAIRFASVLGFAIDGNTDREIRACRHLLDNLARERVREEFTKLLCGAGAVAILRDYVEVILQFLPELAPAVGFEQHSRYHCLDVWEHTLHALAETKTADPVVRLAILLHDIGKPAVYTHDETGGHFPGHAEVSVRLADEILQRLRYDNLTRQRVLRLVRYHDTPLSAEPKRVKRLLLKMTSEADLLALLEVARCDRLAHAAEFSEPSPAIDEIPAVLEQLRAEEACLSLRSLAVGGNDLMALGVPAGKHLGELLQQLLDGVIDGKLPNDKEILLSECKKILKG